MNTRNSYNVLGTNTDPVIGGAEEDRTPDLRVANATLSQLSYDPLLSGATPVYFTFASTKRNYVCSTCNPSGTDKLGGIK